MIMRLINDACRYNRVLELNFVSYFPITEIRGSMHQLSLSTLLVLLSFFIEVTSIVAEVL